jgi:hypothetical protein
MRQDPEETRELERSIATTRDVAERLCAALDNELRALGERARAAGSHSTLGEVEADLAEATTRLNAVRAKEHELASIMISAIHRGDIDAVHRHQPDSETLRDAAGSIMAEIIELKALRAEMLRPAD